MKNKIILISTVLIITGFSGLLWQNRNSGSLATEDVSTSRAKHTSLAKTISGSGNVQPQNQETLFFLASGRVAYLGFAEGDRVSEGVVIASLDATVLEHSVTSAEAQYRSAQAALNKVLDDIHLFQYGNGGFANVGSANETQTQKTARQEAEEAVNVAYDNLQSAKKELELSTIIAPFNGKISSIQNISPGTNVSLVSDSSVTVAGGGPLKFVANILEQDIGNIHQGQPVTIKLDADKLNNFKGTVEKIAPTQTVLPDGRKIVKVDIQSDDLQTNARAGQTGTIEVSINLNQNAVVPSWLILANKYIWVFSANRPQLKQITAGQTVDGFTQVTSGLSGQDQVILNPEVIAKGRYKFL